MKDKVVEDAKAKAQRIENEIKQSLDELFNILGEIFTAYLQFKENQTGQTQSSELHYFFMKEIETICEQNENTVSYFDFILSPSFDKEKESFTPKALELQEYLEQAYNKAVERVKNGETISDKKLSDKFIEANKERMYNSAVKSVNPVIGWTKIYQNQVTNDLPFVKPKFDLTKKNGLFKSQTCGNSDLMFAVEQIIRKGGDIKQFDTTARIFLEYAFEQFYNSGGSIGFSFSFAEYAERCQITTKQVYERLNNLRETFEHLKISFPGVKGFVIILNILHNDKYARVYFGSEIYEYISGQKRYSMYTSPYMQTINTKLNPHTYYILKKLSFDKHMQIIGKQKPGKHNISKLLECAIELPVEEAVNLKYKEKIMKPFMRDLNKLVTDGIIKIKFYNGNEEITNEDVQNLRYSKFKKLTYDCELVNYPQNIKSKSNENS